MDDISIWVSSRLDAFNLSPQLRERAQAEMETGIRNRLFDPKNEEEARLATSLVASGLNVPDLKSIMGALGALDLGQETFQQWLRAMARSSATGFFCPSEEEEMAKTIEALRAGLEAPFFARSG